MRISLAFSTCPNDTFMFDALVNGRLPEHDVEFDLQLADIFHLNQLALSGAVDMVKLSYATYAQVQQDYALLDAGSALGFGCGPLLIAKAATDAASLAANNLPVAIPGRNTTANLLLDYYAPAIRNRREMIFHEIMPAVLRGEVAAGLIIHENRFTYAGLGLHLVKDLGEYWEEKTGLPIPLGAIAVHRRLGVERIAQLEGLMRDSVRAAFGHPELTMPFVRAHAQEMDEAVMKAHIGLYVNDFSLSLGEKGRAAVAQLLALAHSPLSA